MPLVKNALCQTLHTDYPFWQAPLPFDILPPAMAGQISAQGGHGILRIAAHDTRASLESKIQNYQQYHDRPSFCFSHRLPQQPQGDAPDYYVTDIIQQRCGTHSLHLSQGEPFSDLLPVALAARPRAIGFAQGIPDAEVFAHIKAQGVQTFVICHNMLELLTADDFGCDLFVLQGNEAGGERCTFSNQLPALIQPALSLLQQARTHTDKPLILWGDCSDSADIVAAMISGAQSVMLERPFLACPENGLDDDSRQQVISSSEFASVISNQFTARPMRCLANDFTRNPEKLLVGNETLFAAAFVHAPHLRPLPVALSPIDDPQNLAQFFAHQKQQIQQYLV